MENDEDFANAKYIPDGESYPARWAEAAAAFRARQGGEFDIAYGEAPRERVDLFLPEGEPRGLVVFVHGGYWHKFDPKSFSHLAAGPLARGWAVAMPGYTLAPEARIHDMTRQVARAIDAMAARVAGPIVLSGHSAGGHLALRMGNEDVALAARPRVARIVPISPLTDLGPLMKTSMNDLLRIDAVEALLESPARRTKPSCPVTIWVGEAERPVFVYQARMLYRVWSTEFVLDPGRHHFDIIEALTDPESALTRSITG